jgi:septal ring factor EnvC (AmiA/AmiB activator)
MIRIVRTKTLVRLRADQGELAELQEHMGELEGEVYKTEAEATAARNDADYHKELAGQARECLYKGEPEPG